MTPRIALADRNASVREAARAWKKAGAIDAAALAAIEAAYPDERQGMGPVFRALLFLFTLISVNGAFGFFLALGPDIRAAGIPVLLLLFGAGLIAATDFQVTLMYRARGGVEAATSLMGIGYLVGFVFWIFDNAGLKVDNSFAATFLAAALLLAGAAWRWGYPLYAGGAMAAFLGSLLVFSWARPAWIVLCLLAAPVLTRLSESPRLPPSHRASCAFALGVALAALYTAVNLVSYDLGWIGLHGTVRVFHPGTPGAALRWLFIAATALVPLLYLAVGLRSRRYVYLLLGAGTAVASLES